MIADFGGLAKQIPVFTVFFMIVTFSSIGLPGLNGFVGEFLVLLGTFKTNVLYATLATTGVILSACYMLWMFQRVMFNKLSNKKNRDMADLNRREWAVILPVVMLIFFIGIYPKPIISRLDTSVNHLLSQVDAKYKKTVNRLEADKEKLVMKGDPLWK
jgi:NADH-quinone oxidoreductase subunit M